MSVGLCDTMETMRWRGARRSKATRGQDQENYQEVGLTACLPASRTPHPTLLATGEDLEVGELLWGDLVDWRQREQQLHHTC